MNSYVMVTDQDRRNCCDIFIILLFIASKPANYKLVFKLY